MRYKERYMKTVADLLKWEPLLTADQQAKLLNVPRPERIHRRCVPENLNGLTLEQLDRLWHIRSTRELFTVSGFVLFGWSEKQTLKADAFGMLGVVNFVVDEVKRIGALFDAIASKPTAQEVLAGCDALDFGTFGLADWYTQRMGLQEHDRAFATPWVRVYQCRANDNAVAQYQRRLADIKTKELQQKYR